MNALDTASNADGFSLSTPKKVAQKASTHGTRLIAFCPSLVSITGSHSAAAILSQIMYWHQGRLRVERKGTYWLAKSRAEMCEETGVTLDQYKRIMPLLTRKGLIITARGLFKNKVTPFIRLTEEGHRVMQQFFVKRTVVSSDQLVATAPNQLVASPPNLLTVTTTEITEKKEDQISTGETSFAKTTVTLLKSAGETECKEVEQKKEVEVVGEIDVALVMKSVVVKNNHPWWAMKAADVLKAHQASLNGALGAYWQSRIKLVWNPKFQPPLTLKQKGQLSHLQKKCGEMTKPLIAWVVEHWWKFSQEAAASAGTSCPVDPDIGFLLKHYGVAMNLLLPQPTPVLKEKPVPVVQPIAKPTEPAHVITSQELTDILMWLDAKESDAKEPM